MRERVRVETQLSVTLLIVIVIFILLNLPKVRLFHLALLLEINSESYLKI